MTGFKEVTELTGPSDCLEGTMKKIKNKGRSEVSGYFA